MNKALLKFLATVTFFLPISVMAALPTIDTPANTTAGTGVMGTLFGFAFDGSKWMGILIVAVGFLSVSALLIAQLHAVHNGKKSWGEAGAIFVAGVAIIGTVIWMVTKAISTMT